MKSFEDVGYENALLNLPDRRSTVFMTNINHDQLFKELLTTFFVEFLDLFFPSVLEYLDTDSIQFIDKRCDPASP